METTESCWWDVQFYHRREFIALVVVQTKVAHDAKELAAELVGQDFDSVIVQPGTNP